MAAKTLLQRFTTNKMLSSLKNIVPGNSLVRTISLGSALQGRNQRPNCFSQVKPISVVKFKRADNVIIDLDGVLIDTAEIYYDAHAKYLLKFKKRYTTEHKLNTFGVGDLEAAKYMVDELQLPIKPEVYAHGVWQYLRYGLQTRSKLLVGVKNLVCHLSEHKVPIALATSGNTKAFDIKIRDHKWILKYFCFIVKGDDPRIKRGKPYPDIYDLCASKFANRIEDRSRYLVIEDSKVGAQAAKAAGMQTLLLPDKTIPHCFIEGAADSIITKLTDFDLMDFDLPQLPEGKVY